VFCNHGDKNVQFESLSTRSENMLIGKNMAVRSALDERDGFYSRNCGAVAKNFRTRPGTVHNIGVA
jgi:hypothetical protein